MQIRMCRYDRNAVALSKMDVIPIMMTLLARTDCTRAFVEAALTVLVPMTFSPANTRQMWDLGGFEIVLNAASRNAASPAVLKVVTGVLWKMLSAQHRPPIDLNQHEVRLGGAAAAVVAAAVALLLLLLLLLLLCTPAHCHGRRTPCVTVP